MLSLMSPRTLRPLLVALLAGLVLTTGGCSLFKKKTPESLKQGSTLVVPEAPPVTPIDTGITPAPRAELPGVPEDFPAEAGIADVHFDYDKADIRKDQMTVLDADLKYFKAHPDVKIMIEGHTDERGTTEYNFALGQRRAAAVQDYLAKSGISADRLFTVSKGKDQPLDPAHAESAFAKNRRAHFMRVVR